jgi:tetratricopeptide (TPR) repeat protein
VLAGEPATPRSDIYSLGVLLFHLLTKGYPCSAADLDGLRAAHADGSRVLLRDLRPDLPDRLVHAVHRALEPDPARRFATAGEMEQGLALALTPAPSARISPSWLIASAAMLAAAVALIVALFVALPTTRPSALPRIESIAVLPFVAPSGVERPALAGLATDVVRELQRFDVVVKDATKAGTITDDLDIQVNADAVVHTALKAGDRTVVNVAVRRAGGSSFFGREYDVYNAALPTVARTIASDLAGAIGALPRAGAPSPARPPNYAAYEAYQRGRVYAEERSETALNRALASFDEASRLDPGYAEPWAGKADVYIAMGVPAFGPLPPLEARRLAKESLLKALELNPDLVEAHTSLAFTSFLHDWNWEAAQERFNRALTLNPQYALAHHWYAEYLNEMSRFDEALVEIRIAQQLNPLSLLIHRDVAWHYFCQGRYEEAIAQLRGTLALDPEYAAAITLLARSLAATGQYTEALSELAKTRGRISEVSYLSFRGHIEAAAGQRRQAERTLADLRAPRREYVPPYYLALIYTALGRTPEALSELERAYLEQDSTLVSVNIDRRFEPLYDEPRFKELIKKMKFKPR